jgi:pilus assembly protein CpaE
MAFNSIPGEAAKRLEWDWKIGLVLESPELSGEIANAIAEAGASKAFEFLASASSFDVANAVDREKPELLFVELARASKPAPEWIVDVRRGEDLPLVVAVHPVAEPAEMITALRAGASEFLSLPVRPAIFDAMERIGVILESRRNATMENGRIIGVLSSKGGCGATSIACHLGAALQIASPKTRVLVADLDYQAPGALGVFRAVPRSHAGEAFESVRRLSSNAWKEFATPVMNGVDLLVSPADADSAIAPGLPEPWRVESLFRFVARQYNWILVDLGRHLNPSNWMLLQNIEELMVITAPDVLALYQTRSVLQTLTSRGFDKTRVRIVLNRNQTSPADFWVESIEQMFEMSVFGVIPSDDATFAKLPRDRYDFPADSPFGRGMVKMAVRLVKPNGNGTNGNAPMRRAA